MFDLLQKMSFFNTNNPSFEDLKSIYDDPFFSEFLSISDWKLPAAQRSQDWSVRLDVRGFKPENIRVKVSDSGEKLIINAEQYDGDDYTRIKRHFPIAEGVDTSAIKSQISANGVLVVRAPYKKPKKLGPRWTGLTTLQDGIGSLMEELLGQGPPKFHVRLADHHRYQLSNLLNWGDLTFLPGGATNVVNDDKGNKNFQIEFNLKQYKPEEIELKLNGRKLILDAKHVEESPNHHVSRVIHKSVSLPNNADLDRMRSILNADGTLQIKAPIAETTSPKKLQITVTNGVL